MTQLYLELKLPDLKVCWDLDLLGKWMAIIQISVLNSVLLEVWEILSSVNMYKTII